MFGFSCTFVVSCLLFLASYALFLPVDATLYFLGGVIFACVVCGLISGYFAFKLSKRFAIPFLGATGGAIGFMMLTRLFKLYKWYYMAVFGIIGAVIGWFLSTNLRTLIRCVGTSLIGSFLFIRGIGCYAPGYPNELEMNVHDLVKNPKENMIVYGYLGGFAVMLLVGSIY